MECWLWLLKWSVGCSECNLVCLLFITKLYQGWKLTRPKTILTFPPPQKKNVVFIILKNYLYWEKRLKNCKTLPRQHLISCQGVGLFLLNIDIFHNSSCHNLSFWILSQLGWFLSQLRFVTFWVFEFCHNLRFCVLSQFRFLIFITIWVFDPHHNLSFLV